MGGKVPPNAEKWAFISQRLNFRVGEENISKINNFRIIVPGIHLNIVEFKHEDMEFKIFNLCIYYNCLH